MTPKMYPVANPRHDSFVPAVPAVPGKNMRNIIREKNIFSGHPEIYNLSRVIAKSGGYTGYTGYKQGAEPFYRDSKAGT